MTRHDHTASVPARGGREPHSTSGEFHDPGWLVVYDLLSAYAPGTRPASYRGLARRVGARLIVDLGCGTGRVTPQLAQAGFAVIGVDPSPQMLAVAQPSSYGRRAVATRVTPGMSRAPDGDS